jgi:hypothetical protein
MVETIPGVLFWLLSGVLWVRIIVWAVIDASKRGKSAWLVGILVAFFFPCGLIIWLIFRPELLPD